MPKILIVDDSPTIRAALAVTISAMKLDAVPAGSGEEALEKFVAERPSLVLLDVNMPGIDGYETARRIRAVAPEEWVPIIFLSASEDDQDLKRAIECGGDDYLVKPVSTVVLNAKMRALQRLDQMRRKLVEVSDELTAANQRLETLSHQDGLTGIANRRAFDFLILSTLAKPALKPSKSVFHAVATTAKSFSPRVSAIFAIGGSNAANCKSLPPISAEFLSRASCSFFAATDLSSFAWRCCLRCWISGQGLLHKGHSAFSTKFSPFSTKSRC